MKYEAIVQWILPEVGGRGMIPEGRYIAPAQFEGHDGLWSLELHVNGPIEAGMSLWSADVWFLADTAPQDWLKPEARFRLFEGNRVVAVGQCMHRTITI